MNRDSHVTQSADGEEWMMRRNGPQCLLVCALLLVAAVLGCGKSEYMPDLRVVQAHRIIDAPAEFHDVYPAPALVSGKESVGLIEPNTARVAPSVLTEQVEKTLLASFDQARVFSKLVT